MNKIFFFMFRCVRKLIFGNRYRHPLKYDGYVDLKGQEGNDYIFSFLSNRNDSSGKMICKFGTVELCNVISVQYSKEGWNKDYLLDVLHGDAPINKKDRLNDLCNNAGFFPCNEKLRERYYYRMIEDMHDIDVLGSYYYLERHVERHLINIKKRIDLDGFYAPFMWKRPWTRFLKNKRVLVVHPFVESIRFQYEHNRENLFDNKEVLPEFRELLTLKAVQSIADAKHLPYKNWFEALTYMENEISRMDFDVAIIGCGAYGMCLAAHVKRMGKTAIHLAGWTQMLFGVYGNRWLQDQPEYAKYINKYWIRPNESERPKGLGKVENGCYW